MCTAAGGTCTVERDGYYVMSAICLGAGFLLLVFFMIPTARRLQCAFTSLSLSSLCRGRVLMRIIWFFRYSDPAEGVARALVIVTPTTSSTNPFPFAARSWGSTSRHEDVPPHASHVLTYHRYYLSSIIVTSLL